MTARGTMRRASPLGAGAPFVRTTFVLPEGNPTGHPKKSSSVRHKAIVVLILLLSTPIWAQTDGPAKPGIPPAETVQVLEALDHAQSQNDLHLAIEKVKKLPPSSRNAMRAYVSDPHKNGQKRFQVLRQLCLSLPRDAAEKELHSRLSETRDEPFRMQILMEMGRERHRSLKPLLKEILINRRETSGAQVAAAAGLAFMGDPAGRARALEAITRAEPDSDLATLVLVRLQATDLIPELEKAIASTKEYFVRNECRKAILKIEMAQKDANGKIALLKGALFEDGFWHARQWAAIQLGIMGTREAAAALSEVARNPKAVGQGEAIRGLRAGVEAGIWTNEEVTKWLGK